MKSNRIQTMLFDSSATSTAILFLMLSVRLTDNYLADWIFTSEIPAWFNYLYAFSLYILTTLLLWLNKKKLIDMNIDFSSVNIFLFGGTLLFFYVPRELGWVLIATMIFFYLGTKNDLPRTNKKKYPLLTWLLIASAVGLSWLPVLFYSPSVKSTLKAPIVFQALLQAQLPIIIFEEVLFRGALVAFLRKRGFRNCPILIFQTVLFWISHHSYLSQNKTYVFWVSIPLLAILLGMVTLKSKSLAPSIAAHFLFNFTSTIILSIY